MGSRRLRPLARLGILSPLATLETFSPGAQRLLRQAERTGETALHGARAVFISVVVIGITMSLQVPLAGVALGVSVLVLLWLLALRGIRSEHAFVPTRYALAIFDVWLVIDAMVWARTELMDGVASAMGVDLDQIPPEFFAAFTPPLLVFIALSSALRLDPRAAGLTAFLAVTAYVTYAVWFEVPAAVALPIGALVVFGGILGTNTARAVRYLLLKTQTASVLESYVPEAVTRELDLSGSIDKAGRLEEVTLLLCDIRGFTQISERLSPSETVALVNSYLDAVCPPIVSSGGVIDKFMGDGVLAFIEGGGHASRALEAARRIIASISRAGNGIRVGVALHTGEVLIGSIGPRSRREYTIISDAVNTVTRLEELNKKFGSQIVASARTLSQVAEPDRADFSGPETISLRGRAEPVTVHYFKG